MLKVKKLTESAKLPTRGSAQAAGLDIFAAEDTIIYAGETKKISTGIAIELPEGTVGVFMDRSSLGNKGVHNLAGVIDSDYRGELFVVLHYLRDKRSNELVSGLNYYKVNKGDKITQLVILQLVQLQPTEVNELAETERFNNGFGSTGV